MKKVLSLGLLAVLAVVILTSSTPKKKKSKQFRGIVTFAISYESEEMTDLQKSKMPSEYEIKMYDGMSRYEMTFGPLMQTIITNPDANKMILLFEVGLKKASMSTEYDKMNNDSIKKFTTSIDYSTDTKVIAGYACKKAIVTFTPKEGVEEEEKMYSVYYSSELGDTTENTGSDYAGIDGLLLEFYDVDEGLVTKFTATEVVKGKVKDLDFLLPADYKEFTDGEEMQKYLMEQ